ncbi:MAG TPA: hypothetical protein VKT78_08770 [Fimbriimonadaceae bacterium]|nr:hypothetical protein [Fimbriimonadaceae bacterium]
MAEDATELKIPLERRAGCAVFAVAIGDHLGLDVEALRRLRQAAESSTLTGEAELDEILGFVANMNAPSASVRLQEAYAAVAPVIQPLRW